MSITDELRKYARGYKPMVDHTLLEIADRIDKAYESSYKDGYDEGAADILAFCDRLKEAAEGREDVTLWGVDYTALPVDRNGASVHVDDVMTNGKYVFVVNRISRYTDEWLVCDLNGVAWTASEIWHYEAQTVEDVLEEFAQMYIACNDKGTIAEYAKRLRLAEREDS